MLKRFLCLFLAFAFLFCLVSCGEDESAEASTDKSPADEASMPAYKPEPMINGARFSEFTVVYKNNVSDTAKFKTAAQSFVKQVKEIYGVTLKCTSDNAAETENEIIFGISQSREICKDNNKKYEIGGYDVEVRGRKVVFSATYANGALGASEEFLKKISDSEKVSDMKFEGEKKVVKVACVGDSITYGATSTNDQQNYPNYLQEMLGLDYHVLNAGISGYSIVSTDQYAYKKSNEFSQAISFLPDVVLFALGTNDANPTPNQPYKDWENEANDRANRFDQSTNELLDAFIAENNDVQIIMLLPTSLFKVGDDGWNAEAWNANLTKHVIPRLKRIAEERSLMTVDLYSWSLENKNIFVDGLHPQNATYKPFARFIYDSVKNDIKKP